MTRQVQDEMSRRQRDWNGFDGEKHVIVSTDKVKRIERNGHLFVMRMLSTLNHCSLLCLFTFEQKQFKRCKTGASP